MIISNKILLRMMFLTKVVEKIKTHIILCSITHPPPPRTSCRLWANVEKYVRSKQDTDGNIIWCVRVSCWITKATDTLWMYSTSFPTPTIGTRTRVSVTFYVHCLSCSPSDRMNSGFCCESNTRLRDRQPGILGSTPSKGTVFSLFQSVQTVCGAHSASCSVGQEYFTPGQPGGGGEAHGEWSWPLAGF